MSTQENEYQLIFSYLRSLNFHFLDSWVIECVNYYKSNNPRISFNSLKNEVKQQWLLVNLREIKIPSLPPDLKSKEKTILSGSYAVQVESMIDSSKSCYSQFQKLLRIDVGDIEATKNPEEWNQPKFNRCLTFVMCDGVQEIEAMEYQPIKKIRTNDPELLPGFKMIIIGPVECRKGMILLKDENVRLCGGEVESLAVSNCLKNIIIKKLELDENDYLDLSALGNLQSPVQGNSTDQIVKPSNLDNEVVESLLSQNDDIFLNLSLESENLPQTSTNKDDDNTTNKKKHSLPIEDVNQPKQKRQSLDPLGWDSTEMPDLDEQDMFSDDFELLIGTKTKTPTQKTDSNASTSNDPQKPVLVDEKPFVYLKQIFQVKLNNPLVVFIKAVILTLKKKITIENDEFSLKATITDGSACIDVDFCSEILENLLGYSPCEMAVMLKTKQTNSAMAQRIKESFSKAQEKLISLNCIMKIKFFMNLKSPLILSLEEVTKQHLTALKQRSL